ncbi:hypothetical protein EG832_14435, partial [bacterium]|nr:hypothetical protein [bacterium]
MAWMINRKVRKNKMNLEDLKKEFENDAPHVLLKLYEWAVKQPNKKFLYYGEENQHITYAEFNEITNRIGNSLHSMGVAKGDRISLLLFNPLLT